MRSMRDVIRILENADFDHRIHDVDDLHTFDYKEFSDKGRADIDTRGVYPRADNALADGPDEEIIIDIENVEEDINSIEPDPIQLSRLQQILNGELKITDQTIRKGPINLDDNAKHQIAGRLGVSVEDLDALNNTLTQQLRDKQGDDEENKMLLTSLKEEYHRMMRKIKPPLAMREAGYSNRPFKKVNGWWYPPFQDPGPDHPLPMVSPEEVEAERLAAAERVKQKRAKRALDRERAFEQRFYAEPDSLGNLTVRDSETGDTKFVQGGQATELTDQLKSGANQDAVLAPLFERASNPESDSYHSEIGAASGTFNFPWHLGPHHGFATVFYNDAKQLELQSVMDMGGEEIDLDNLPDPQREQLVQQARDFINSGDV